MFFTEEQLYIIFISLKFFQRCILGDWTRQLTNHIRGGSAYPSARPLRILLPQQRDAWPGVFLITNILTTECCQILKLNDSKYNTTLTNVYCSLQAFLIMDNNHNKESHTSTMAGQSADDTITGADNNNRLERLLIQMNTMSSNMEKVLSEIPKACAGAIHDCLHLVSSAITKEKTKQNLAQSSSSL